MRNPASASSMNKTRVSSTISSTTSTTTTTPCCSKVGLKRGPWTPEEDELLSAYIRREGEGRWRTLPKRAGLLRCGKSCRLRWMNYLRPSVKRGQISPDEEDLILRLHRLLGNRWALIAGRIPGRTDNEIKNYWNTHLSKKLISQGIDPRTHKPLIINPNPNPNITTTSLSTEVPPAANNYPNPKSSSSAGLKLREEGHVYLNQDQDSIKCRDDLGVGLENVDNIGVRCGDDDIFSSFFLNSLIEEDGFASQLHQQQQQLINGIGPLDPLLASCSQFGCGTIWEHAEISSFTSAFGEDEN